ncbi:MAG: hypothetical protein JKY09_08040 [Crocinitomicaceae bacterium]|nr:hypothetical protein [Crocinitomicaceae bacterium]
MYHLINPSDAIEFSLNRAYCTVKTNDIATSIDRISELFYDKKTRRVILDTTIVENVPNVWSLYEISKKIPDGIRIAVVTSKKQLSCKNLSFFETTSRNKGKTVRVFNSMSDAENWLIN